MMIDKFTFETSVDIETEEYLKKTIHTFKDVHSLKTKATATFDQRPKNTGPGGWDIYRQSEYLTSTILGMGVASPIYLRDLESSIEVYRNALKKLDKEDAEDWQKVKKIEKIIKKLQQRIDKYGPYHILDGQHRCDFIWNTLGINSDNFLPVPYMNENTMWYRDSQNKTRTAALLGADKKPLKFSNLEEDAKDFINNLKCRIVIVKNLTDENASLFFKSVNVNYHMTPFLLEWTISLNETKEWIEDLLSNNPVLYDKENQNGLFDRIIGKDSNNNETSYRTEYCGEYRLISEMIALYTYNRKKYNNFDYDFNKVISVLKPDFEPQEKILDMVKQNLTAIADATYNSMDFHQISRVQLYDVMSVLMALESKSHPVRTVDSYWDTELIAKDKKEIVIEILKTIDHLKEEDLYVHDNGNWQTVKTQLTTRSKPKVREHWQYYRTKDEDGNWQRTYTTYKEDYIPDTDMYKKVVSNDHSYSAHTRDQNNIHERDKMILKRLEEKIPELEQYGWLVKPRDSANRNKFAKSIVRNTGTLNGERVISIKGAKVSDGHIDPYSNSQNESLSNLKPENIEFNIKKGTRNLG